MSSLHQRLIAFAFPRASSKYTHTGVIFLIGHKIEVLPLYQDEKIGFPSPVDHRAPLSSFMTGGRRPRDYTWQLRLLTRGGTQVALDLQLINSTLWRLIGGPREKRGCCLRVPSFEALQEMIGVWRPSSACLPSPPQGSFQPNEGQTCVAFPRWSWPLVL